jgi:hypothetical protein
VAQERREEHPLDHHIAQAHDDVDPADGQPCPAGRALGWRRALLGRGAVEG